MTQVFINPGSGPVANATEKHAIENIKHFITDCGVDVEWLRMPKRDSDGRFSFLLWSETRCHEIEMPGIPLSQVRFMDEEGQNIWKFPRLYVDGSSWIWKFALLDEDSFKEPEA